MSAFLLFVWAMTVLLGALSGWGSGWGAGFLRGSRLRSSRARVNRAETLPRLEPLP